MDTILFGNGLNMLTESNASWAELVSAIDIAKNEERIPFTLQYEAKLSDSPKSYQNTNNEILANIVNTLKEYKSNGIYDWLASLDIEHYITTNYDYVMKKALSSQGYKRLQKEGSDRYSLRRRICCNNSGKGKRIWHIHGDIDAKTSIMLGLGYYGAKISRMKDYIDGNYCYDYKKKKIPVGPLKNRLQTGIAEPESWIDLFFISNIHILGYGFYYDEIDLWWLLAKRKELLSTIKITPSRIIYYGNVDKGKSELLSKLGVDIVDYDCYPKKTSSYLKMYEYFVEKIANTL